MMRDNKPRVAACKAHTTNRGTAMEAEHKEKLAKGRADARAVKAYLTYLEENKPKRGRRRTEETVTNRLEAIDSELAEANPLTRLNLVQEQIDLQLELERLQNAIDATDLRQQFVEAAARYASAKGITREAFRTVGVDAATLTEAGIK